MPDNPETATYILAGDASDAVAEFQKFKKASDAVVASAEDQIEVEAKRTRVIKNTGTELERLEARYDRRIKLEKQLAAEQARMARLEKEGVGSPEERARVYSLVETSIRRQIDDLNKQEVAMRKSSTATGLARHEMINLSRQIQDVGVSLAGGQSPFRILVEQGSQIADIFASSRATVGDFFRSIGAGIGRLGAGAAFAGIAAGIIAIGAGAVTAALNWGSARNDIEKALLGIGRASGATVDSIEKIATTSASTFGLSISEAREFAGILAATGRIGIEQIGGLTQLGKNLAITLGVDSTEAAKTLAKALAEPGKGVESLNEKLGVFSAGTVRVVQNLVAQNKIMEAQKVIAEGVAEATKNAGEAASTSIQFWTALGNTLSDVWTTIGKIAARTTGIGLKVGVDEAVEEAQKALEAARQQQDIGGMPGVGIGPDPERIRQAEEALRKATEAQARWRAEAEATAENIRSLADAKLIRDLSPEIAQMEEIRNRAEGLALILERTRAAMAEGEFMPGAAPEIARAGASMEQLALSAARAKEAAESMLSPAQKLTAEFQVQAASITARTSAQRAAVAARQTEVALAGQAVSWEEKILAIRRASYLVLLQAAQAHKDNMAALEGQLAVAKALPGHAQQVAQYEADINARLREGATLMQAEAEAAMKRAIAVQQANNAVDQQIISLRQGVEMERARLEGTEASVAAAHAYANAMRSGASETKAAALAAATLEANLERAQIAAEMMANQVGRSAANANDLGAKLAAIGTGGARGGFGAGQFTPGALPGQFGSVTTHWGTGGGPLVGAAGISTAFNVNPSNIYGGAPGGAGWGTTEDVDAILRGFQSAADEQAQAARKAQEAADAQRSAAEQAARAAEEQAAAAKAAREARISQLDEMVADIVATKLLAGQSAQAVNMLIETGAIQFGTASTRFQTQLDLYKRAGASNAQIAADIRAGIIGESARPSELLAALDSLTDAVDANTDAQLGLSPFYTSQGDRQLGYRGYTVQKGLSNIPGAGAIGGIGGIGTGGTGGMVGGMGGVVNPPGQVSAETTPGFGQPLNLRIGPNGQPQFFDYASGQWVNTTTSAIQSMRTAAFQAAGYQLLGFQEGGIVDRPTMAVAGERGPEAFVPLKGGAIPVRLIGNAANQNQPANIVNINAPLVHFASEPTRDEVRQSAFQAAQMLRRVAMG